MGVSGAGRAGAVGGVGAFVAVWARPGSSRPRCHRASGRTPHRSSRSPRVLCFSSFSTFSDLCRPLISVLEVPGIYYNKYIATY